MNIKDYQLLINDDNRDIFNDEFIKLLLILLILLDIILFLAFLLFFLKLEFNNLNSFILIHKY